MTESTQTPLRDTLRLPESLMGEQDIVAQLITQLWSKRVFITVQGVPGSGKTTIALHSLKRLAVNSSHLFDSRSVTPVLITYSQTLAQNCHDSLHFDLRRSLPANRTRALLAPLGSLEPFKINVVTLREFCLRLVDDSFREHMLSDEACRRIVSEIAVKHGVSDLLPSQIFSLITSFLRGREDIKDLQYAELKHKLETSRISATYRTMLLKVKQYVVEDYRLRLSGNRYDRSDLALEILRTLREIEHDLDEFREWARDTESGRVEAVKAGWVRSFLKSFKNNLSHGETATRYLRELDKNKVGRLASAELADWVMARVQREGVCGTPIFDRIGSTLTNPVILIDEIQDLTQVESALLVSLFFQLPRNEHSRLVFLGDLNQQMLPTGFRWEDLREGMESQRIRYGFSKDYFDPDLPLAKNMDNRSHPFRLLGYNYRTTEEVARLAFEVIRSMATRSLQEKELTTCLENLIDPALTQPDQVADEYLEISKDPLKRADLLPRIVVVREEDFVAGVEAYVQHQQAQAQAQRPDDEVSSRLVVIAQDDHILTDLDRKEGDTLKHLTHFPLLACKGLEFKRCAVFGLPARTLDLVEQDVIGQYYTVLTRARLMVTVFLTRPQFEFLLRATGWERIGEDVASFLDLTVGSPKDAVAEIVGFLERLGRETLTAEQHRSAGEEYFLKFVNSLDEGFLRESISYYRRGGADDDALEAIRQGAQMFESRRSFGMAMYWYETVQDIESWVRCAKERADELRGEGKPDEAAALQQRAVEEVRQWVAQATTDAFELASLCWELLGDTQAAIDCSLKAGQLDRAATLSDRLPQTERELVMFDVLDRYLERARSATGSSVAIDEVQMKAAVDVVKKHLGASARKEALKEALIKIASVYENAGDEHAMKAFIFLAEENLEDRFQTLVRRFKDAGKYRLLLSAMELVKRGDEILMLAESLKTEGRVEAAAYAFENQKRFTPAAHDWITALKNWRSKLGSVIGPSLSAPLEDARRDDMIAWVTTANRLLGATATQRGLIREIKNLPALESSGIEKLRGRLAKLREELADSAAWQSEVWNALASFIAILREFDVLLVRERDIVQLDKMRNVILNPELAESARLTVDQILEQIRAHAEEVILRLPAADHRPTIARFLYFQSGNHARAKAFVAELWASGDRAKMNSAVECWAEIPDEIPTAKAQILGVALPENFEFATTALRKLYGNRAGLQRALSDLDDRLERTLLDLWNSLNEDTRLEAVRWWRQLDRIDQGLGQIRELDLPEAHDLARRSLEVLFEFDPAMRADELKRLDEAVSRPNRKGGSRAGPGARRPAKPREPERAPGSPSADGLEVRIPIAQPPAEGTLPAMLAQAAHLRAAGTGKLDVADLDYLVAGLNRVSRKMQDGQPAEARKTWEGLKEMATEAGGEMAALARVLESELAVPR